MSISTAAGSSSSCLPRSSAFIPSGEGSPGGHHELFLMCDDIDSTVAELTAKGAAFSEPVNTTRFGRLTRMRIPGGGTVGLYQPSHATAYDIEQ